MYVTRCNQKQIYKAFHNPMVTAILGPRRVGKTTLVENFVAQNSKELWVRLNMDSLSERLRIKAGELERLIEEKAKQKISSKDKIWVTIDEAQKSPELFEQIKIIYDHFKDQNVIKFILTGSGLLTLHRLSAESLAGRIYFFHLREFNLRETYTLTHKSPLEPPLFDSIAEATLQNWQFIEKQIANTAIFRPDLEKILSLQLLWGGLPEVLMHNSEEERLTYLGNYLQTYLEKDVRAISTITDLYTYRNLMVITAEQTGSLKDEKRILQALQCSRDTIKKYRGFLEATLAYQEIYPYIGSSLKRLTKSPKAYLLNNGLVSYLTGISSIDILNTSGMIGHRLENWFLKELQVWLDRSPKKSEIYYWRTSGNIEVDFVVTKATNIFPFEVTNNKQIDTRKIKHLRTFLQEYKSASFGIYIYGGEFAFDQQHKIFFVPSWAIT